MTPNEGAIATVTGAEQAVLQVVRTFMRTTRVSQEAVGDALGLSQRQVSRRLSTPGTMSAGEVAGFAQLFGVSPATLYKPVPEALRDLAAAMTEGASVGGARRLLLNLPAQQAA